MSPCTLEHAFNELGRFFFHFVFFAAHIICSLSTLFAHNDFPRKWAALSSLMEKM